MVVYHEFNGTGPVQKHLKIFQSNNMLEQRNKAYSGQLTDGAKKRMRRAIELLCMGIKPVTILNPVSKRYIKHRLSFITLTVSAKENITAKEAYNNLLTHFMQWLRRTQNVSTYVWKAEVQKRGQIHYHITTPTFIHYKAIRDKWNNLQRKAGYLSNYYESKGHYDANSTDVHQVRHIDNLSSYLQKEFCKSIQNPQTIGKIWDCSMNLKKSKYFNIILERWHEDALGLLSQKGYVTIEHHERFSLVKLHSADYSQVLTLSDTNQLDAYLKQILTKKQVETIKAKKHSSTKK